MWSTPRWVKKVKLPFLIFFKSRLAEDVPADPVDDTSPTDPPNQPGLGLGRIWKTSMKITLQKS